LQILVYPIETERHLFELRNDDPDGLNERSEPNNSPPQNSVHLVLSESQKQLIAIRNPLTGDEALLYEINRLKNNSSQQQVVFVPHQTPEQAFTAAAAEAMRNFSHTPRLEHHSADQQQRGQSKLCLFFINLKLKSNFCNRLIVSHAYRACSAGQERCLQGNCHGSIEILYDPVTQELYQWVRPLPGKWHLSLCMRLTIGSTFGPALLHDWVKQALAVSIGSAEYLCSGKNWRRSSELFFVTGSAVVRHFVQQWFQTTENKTPADFRKWLVSNIVATLLLLLGV
jgi:hypothetical protein